MQTEMAKSLWKNLRSWYALHATVMGTLAGHRPALLMSLDPAQIQDCSIVEGKLQEYRQAFEAIDSSGDGTINGGELSRVFQALGQPIKPEKLAKLMDTVDRDMNGRVSWTEFIGIFRHELLDLQAIQKFVQMQPKCSKKQDGKLVEVNCVCEPFDTCCKALHLR